MTQCCLLTWAIFLPMIGAIALALLPKGLSATSSRWVSLLFSAAAGAVGFYLLAQFEPQGVSLQFEENVPWLASWGVSYHIGLDGLNVALVLMTLWLFPLIIASSWSLLRGVDSQQVKTTLALLLVMETGALGTFLSQDLFLFYVFWEVILIPCYLLLGMYGDKDKMWTAVQFFVYTFAGSLVMFFAILWLLWQQKMQTGMPSADIRVLTQLKHGPEVDCLFWALGIGFFVKAGLIPFHGWLYATYKNAPMLLTIVLSAILAKMGIYGVYKVLIPMFPQASVKFGPVALWMATIGMIYGAMLAFVQKDLKSMISYASLSHANGILIGLFALNSEGMTGAIFQAVSHAVITFGLFFVAGIFERRNRSCDFDKLGGLARTYPWLSVAFFCLALGLVSLPGTNGFVGEFLILLGSFKAVKAAGVITAVGMLLVAGYVLKAYQLAMFGTARRSFVEGGDLDATEGVIFALLIVVIFVFGVCPNAILLPSEHAVLALLKGLMP